MKKIWSSPEIEALDLSQTAAGKIVSSVGDGQSWNQNPNGTVMGRGGITGGENPDEPIS